LLSSDSAGFTEGFAMTGSLSLLGKTDEEKRQINRESALFLVIKNREEAEKRDFVGGFRFDIRQGACYNTPCF
jgi:hypothetical protein